MANSKVQIDENEYKTTLKKMWDLEFVVDKLFPPAIAKWVRFQSTMLGVAPSYIGLPLLVGGAYLSQHTIVSAGNGIHKEPIILYSLVAGRSGNANYHTRFFYKKVSGRVRAKLS